ncbi:hypothetical protein Scep_012029 [Stephania cephalantha]|uniref:Uncharacterized protein n=1 Tax=Stephania cephalantha TaxID=152367 RepID=A0AAP0JE79_9MAGN
MARICRRPSGSANTGTYVEIVGEQDRWSSSCMEFPMYLLGDVLRLSPYILRNGQEEVIEQESLQSSGSSTGLASPMGWVILEVAPETLYSEILTKVFKGFLFETSSLHCGSFIIQALVSSARCKGQMDLIWVELGGKFKELLEIGRAGVVASILAASQRLQCYGQKAPTNVDPKVDGWVHA